MDPRRESSFVQSLQARPQQPAPAKALVGDLAPAAQAAPWWKPSWLFGSPAAAAPIVPGQFGQNRPFPSQADLDLARKSEEFRHTGEFTPNTFQVSNAQVDGGTAGIRLATAMGALGAPTDQELINTLGRNKLAARRSAIVSLAAGDPRDQVVGAKDFTYENFAGKTLIDPTGEDPMFSFFGREDERDPSTPTHEAAHRGMFKLAEALKNMPESEETSRVRDYLRDPNTQELAVRALMHDVYGDPEAGNRPEKYTTFLEGKNPGAFSSGTDLAYAREMNRLAEAIAQKLVKQRKPGGPW